MAKISKLSSTLSTEKAKRTQLSKDRKTNLRQASLLSKHAEHVMLHSSKIINSAISTYKQAATEQRSANKFNKSALKIGQELSQEVVPVIKAKKKTIKAASIKKTSAIPAATAVTSKSTPVKKTHAASKSSPVSLLIEATTTSEIMSDTSPDTNERAHSQHDTMQTSTSILMPGFHKAGQEMP